MNGIIKSSQDKTVVEEVSEVDQNREILTAEYRVKPPVKRPVVIKPQPPLKPTRPAVPAKPGLSTGAVLSALSRLFLDGFVAPFVVGYTLNALTGKKTLNHPAGSQTNPDGTVTYPNGSVAHPDNSITHADGSKTEPDGQVVTYPSGEKFNQRTGVLTFPDGTSVQGVKEGGEWVFAA